MDGWTLLLGLMDCVAKLEDWTVCCWGGWMYCVAEVGGWTVCCWGG